jgi:myo-inositol-1(or 4)-monophosphatase
MPKLSDLEQLARHAGKILRSGYETEHQVSYKGEIDLVTEVDHQSEAYLLGEINKNFPAHQIVSEEAGLVAGNMHEQWLIDPLDGTVNYAHGIPVFCVSIAYAHYGKVELGVVYEPMRDELFSAELGKGAWCNGKPIQCSKVEELKKSLLVTGFPYDIWTTPNNNMAFFEKFSKLTQGVRRFGSAALDLCYVGAGRLEGYWELKLNPWDLAAGTLIAREAGAKVTSLEGSPDLLVPPCSVLAAPPALHEKMMEIFAKGN